MLSAFSIERTLNKNGRFSSIGSGNLDRTSGPINEVFSLSREDSVAPDGSFNGEVG